MDQQLKELCIKCEADSNLKTCLGKYTKPKLKQILDVYGVKMPAAAKKQEMAEKAEDTVKENVISYFNGDGSDRKEKMHALISDGMTLTAYDDLAPVRDLFDRGLIFIRDAGDEAEVVVPVNVKAIMELVDEETQQFDEKSYGAEQRSAREGVQDRSEQDKEVIKYAAAMANMYGIYPANQVKEAWDFNHQRAISPNDVRSALLKAGDADGFYINDSSYIITTMLPTMEDYFAALSNIRRSDTYYYPSEEVIDEFAEGPVYKVAPEYYFLRSYLTRKLDGDEEKAEALISELFVICARDADDAQVIAFINDKGIKFDDDDDKKRFMYLYTCWGYELRIWQCKGYKPSELRVEKLENRNFCRPELGDPKKIKLTGRNDECPCGSGKKYKKCCMKYAE